ncbi:MAG: D-aminoacyl-tRNA deacylase [Dehalococcoidia bacterium]
MEALIQRVSKASVEVEGSLIGRIGPGLLLFIGVGSNDTIEDVRYIADKVTGLRIFSDKEGKFNLSVLDTGGEVLVVSQFTLLADTRKGRRPGFTSAAPPELAESLIDTLTGLIRDNGVRVETGKFQAHMMLEIHNDGPVTIPIHSSDRLRPRKT